MKRILYLLIIFYLFLTQALAPNNTPTTAASNEDEIIGEYIYSSGFVGDYYNINRGGNFEYSTFSDCCDSVWRETGTYILRDNWLHFKVTEKTVNRYNLLDPQQATEAFREIYERNDVQDKVREIKTEYDMYLVRWGARIYLLKGEAMALFTAVVNFGVEPRQEIINENYLTSNYYLRRSDVHKAVVGKPVLPKSWMSYLQDSPIKAAVTKVELQGQDRIYTVDKGSALRLVLKFNRVSHTVYLQIKFYFAFFELAFLLAFDDEHHGFFINLVTR